MSLKERALAAHKERQEYEAEKAAGLFVKRAMATEAAFQKKFDEYLPVAPGTCDTVLAKGGLELRAEFAGEWSASITCFKLKGECLECGVRCYSRHIHNLLDLGKQIEDFVPGYGHKCPAAPEYPTVGDSLLAALQEFICELGEE